MNLLDKLISIEDDTLLGKINDFIGGVDITKTVFKTTDDQKKMLAKSEEDIYNGNLISDKDINEGEDKWLNR
jgi:hypothetical protein